MLIDYNEDQQVPELEIAANMAMNYCKFMNQLMAEIYEFFFQERLPRVFPKMKQMLQLSKSKKIGDWFLSDFGITIRLYGFIHPPHILPAFLTPKIFYLELIRQKLMVEEEHFLNFKKSSNLVFPWKLGPYTVRNRAALPLVSNSLRGMEFPQDQAINYDPHQVISKRRTTLKCWSFEHTEVK